MSEFDSRIDTYEHIQLVERNMLDVIRQLLYRVQEHDRSKLTGIEKETFDRVTPNLRELTYGSDEYKAQLAEMGPALAEHYARNSHHPEHFVDGIRGMTLCDLIEMLCDWEAATHRHADGSLAKSIAINGSRFSYSQELRVILENTAKSFRWIGY
jgi:uncharacterized protein YerC